MHDDRVAGPGGRTVVVTGGTSGIGAAIAGRFAADGDHVIAAGLAAGLGAGSAARELPEKVERVELDVRRENELRAFLGAFEELHVLINAVGIIARGREFESELFADVVGVNLTGTMRSCLAAREALASSRGCIVNIASMLSFFGGGRVPAYSASKGGVLQLTKSLAVAWADKGIRVNAHRAGSAPG